MTLKTDLNDAVLDMFEDDFDSLRTEVTFKVVTGQTVAAGGVVTPTYDTHTAKVIVTSYTVQERASGTVKNDDLKLLLPIKGLGFVPSTKDLIVMPDNTELHIVSPLKKDPSESLYTIQARH